MDDSREKRRTELAEKLKSVRRRRRIPKGELVRRARERAEEVEPPTSLDPASGVRPYS